MKVRQFSNVYLFKSQHAQINFLSLILSTALNNITNPVTKWLAYWEQEFSSPVPLLMKP